MITTILDHHELKLIHKILDLMNFMRVSEHRYKIKIDGMKSAWLVIYDVTISENDQIKNANGYNMTNEHEAHNTYRFRED